MELTIHTHQLQCPPIPHNRTTPMFPQKQSSFSPSRTSYNPRRLVVLRADHTSGGSTRKSMEDFNFNFDFELELKKMKQVSIDGRGSDQSSEEEEKKECRERKLIEELEGLEEEALIMGDDVDGREPIDYNRRARMFDACSKVFQGLKHT